MKKFEEKFSSQSFETRFPVKSKPVLQTPVFSAMLWTPFSVLTEEFTGKFYQRMCPLFPLMQENVSTEKAHIITFITFATGFCKTELQVSYYRALYFLQLPPILFVAKIFWNQFCRRRKIFCLQMDVFLMTWPH